MVQALMANTSHSPQEAAAAKTNKRALCLRPPANGQLADGFSVLKCILKKSNLCVLMEIGSESCNESATGFMITFVLFIYFKYC